MNDEDKLRRTLRIGGVLVMVGCILQAIYRTSFLGFGGLALVWIGYSLVRRSSGPLQKIRKPVPADQRKKAFVIVVILTTLVFASIPFLMHWQNPQDDFWLSVVVVACMWAVGVTAVYRQFTRLQRAGLTATASYPTGAPPQ